MDPTQLKKNFEEQIASTVKQITELEQGLRLGKNFSLLGKESNNG